MGKHRHSQDPSFITSTEWKNAYGGKKNTTHTNIKSLPFLDCALSLTPYQTPVCTKEGVIFDYVNLLTYIQEYKKNPVTGESMSIKDIIKLNMFKNDLNQFHCPITYKTFNNNSHVVVIKTSGNVYLYEAIQELNLKVKNFFDLMTGEKFNKNDILTLQDPTNIELNKLRDINNFVHLKEIRNNIKNTQNIQNHNNTNTIVSNNNVRHTNQTSMIMKEIENKQNNESSLLAKHKMIQASETILLNNSIAFYKQKNEYFEDILDIMELNPLIEDVDLGNIQTDQKTSSSFTSSTAVISTSNNSRFASPTEIRNYKWKLMREFKKKAYVQMLTTVGNINMEIHCDITPRTSWNFLTLCEQGYYNNTFFHRLIPKFMIQGGDPTGTGAGGCSAFHKEFRDEFDSRLTHNTRGILSMANSGGNTNTSQFFITFAPTPHLDLKHTIFGRVVGGLSILDTIEQIGSSGDKNNTPNQEIKILNMSVFNNPIPSVEDQLKMNILEHIEDRKNKRKREQMSIMSVDSNSSNGNAKEKSVDSNSNLKRKRQTETIPNVNANAEVGKIGKVSAGSVRSDSDKAISHSQKGKDSKEQSLALFMTTEGERTRQDMMAHKHQKIQNNNRNNTNTTYANNNNSTNTTNTNAISSGSATGVSTSAAKKKIYGNFNAF